MCYMGGPKNKLESMLNFKEIEERLASLKDIKYGLNANYYSFPEECEN